MDIINAETSLSAAIYGNLASRWANYQKALATGRDVAINANRVFVQNALDASSAYLNRPVERPEGWGSTFYPNVVAEQSQPMLLEYPAA